MYTSHKEAVAQATLHCGHSCTGAKMCMIHLPSAQYNDLCGALMKPTRLQKILKVLAQSTETSFYKLLFIMVRTLLIKQAQLRHTLGDQTLLWVLYHRCQMQVPQRTSPAPAHLARGLVSSSMCFRPPGLPAGGLGEWNDVGRWLLWGQQTSKDERQECAPRAAPGKNATAAVPGWARTTNLSVNSRTR